MNSLVQKRRQNNKLFERTNLQFCLNLRNQKIFKPKITLQTVKSQRNFQQPIQNTQHSLEMYHRPTRIDPSQTLNMCNQFIIQHLANKVKSFQARGLPKNAMVYKNAISSIKKYPMPIVCKAQLQGISGVGEFLSEELEKLVRKRYENFLEDSSQDKFQEKKEDLDDASVVENRSQSVNNRLREVQIERAQNEDTKTTKSATLQYKPRVNTATAQFLQVLNKLLVKYPQLKARGIPKETAQEQVTSKYPSAKNKAWKNMEQSLESNGYITVEREKIEGKTKKHTNENAWYKLTEKGEVYAGVLEDKGKVNDSRSKIIDEVKVFKQEIKSKKVVGDGLSQSSLNGFVQNQRQGQKQKNQIQPKPLKVSANSVDISKLSLVIDSRQRKQKTQLSSFFLQKLSRKYCLSCQTSNLSIGDFLWTYQNQVLDFIIQRKKADDLASSIMDGRYKDQKYRLKATGISNIFYIYEGYPSDNCCRSEKQLNNALMKTRVKERFRVYRTKDPNETMKLLNELHRQIYGKILKGEARYLCGLDEFIEANSVQRNSTVEKVFGLGLMTIPGVGKGAINILTEYFRTYRTMHDYLKRFKSNAERIQFLKNLFKGTGLLTTLPKVLVQLLFMESYGLEKSGKQKDSFDQQFQSQESYTMKEEKRFSIIREDQDLEDLGEEEVEI